MHLYCTSKCQIPTMCNQILLLWGVFASLIITSAGLYCCTAVVLRTMLLCHVPMATAISLLIDEERKKRTPLQQYRVSYLLLCWNKPSVMITQLKLRLLLHTGTSRTNEATAVTSRCVLSHFLYTVMHINFKSSANHAAYHRHTKLRLSQ